MNVKLSMMLALMITGVFPAASIYAWQTGRTDIAPQDSEFARDASIDYVLQNHLELKGLRTPSSWKTQILTPEGWCGSATLRYIGDGWTVNISYPVVQYPEYTVEIDYAGEISFHWKGTVDQYGNIVEMDFTVIQ